MVSATQFLVRLVGIQYLLTTEGWNVLYFVASSSAWTAAASDSSTTPLLKMRPTQQQQQFHHLPFYFRKLSATSTRQQEQDARIERRNRPRGKWLPLSSPSSTDRSSSVWSSQRRKGTTLATVPTNTASSLLRKQKQTLRSSQQLTTTATTTQIRRRRACSFYIWDAPSAWLSKWCSYLQRDCIYEGRGGIKFVRIPPGSILQLLYPCSKYSEDQCLICGGKFHDHLELWWSKNLYTPFDQYIDSTYKSGVLLSSRKENTNHPHEDHHQATMGHKQGSKKSQPGKTRTTTRGKKKVASNARLGHTIDGTSSNQQQDMDIPIYAFHRQYVLEKEELLQKRQSIREQQIRQQSTMSKPKTNRTTATTINNKVMNNDPSLQFMEQRTVTIDKNSITYVVPALRNYYYIKQNQDQRNNKDNNISTPKGMSRRAKSLVLVFARSILLHALDGLIQIQMQEQNEKNTLPNS